MVFDCEQLRCFVGRCGRRFVLLSMVRDVSISDEVVWCGVGDLSRDEVVGCSFVGCYVH